MGNRLPSDPLPEDTQAPCLSKLGGRIRLGQEGKGPNRERLLLRVLAGCSIQSG